MQNTLNFFSFLTSSCTILAVGWCGPLPHRRVKGWSPRLWLISHQFSHVDICLQLCILCVQ